MSKIAAILPARYASSRFPGKPLELIHEKPMIQWVYERVLGMNSVDEVFVATDDQRIYDKVVSFNGKAIMTSEKHVSGTDRVAEAVRQIDDEYEIILNIQGDEPMIKGEMIETLITAFNDKDVNMATLKKRIYTADDINNPNIAKLITDAQNNAIYFSRSTIPFNRDRIVDVSYYKHIGVYGYRREFLNVFSSLGPSMLEVCEQLEQLRALENGFKIKVLETEHQSIGVDLPEHIRIVEDAMLMEGIIK